MQSDEALRREIIQTCLRLEDLGFVIGTYGNVTVRYGDGLLITPSRVDYHTMTPDDIVWVSLDGASVRGSRLPSSELEVHRQIYVRRNDVGAIVHTHSLHATAMSCLGISMPVIVEEQSQVIGGEIACTRYVPAGQHHALGEEVARTIGDSNAVLLANHGVVACGRDLSEAVFANQVAERAAYMFALCRAIQPPRVIPPQHVVSERERWLYKYGSAADGVIKRTP